ncbi:23S rRNA (uracil(1939)-C(5))-methyltransferase RlmD [Mobilitalea sibirica]|uniref:23S rRNA (Uracil(1939)-C(5))-methyltransferase RlmD n=1 Tax=Mobilitalea sibirica TaxID=1462919 RepID=A0A8J7H0D1_9FIRM|nr:23S rRNA (uracil(1939)-C(5))-methyltransferase RlmD [Mobilitalea sibirica]MBH1941829.1 23S rRNA (uracil(1939)-C(5))-methyltransferase RlmD [Mobilitalea sibirica]
MKQIQDKNKKTHRKGLSAGQSSQKKSQEKGIHSAQKLVQLYERETEQKHRKSKHSNESNSRSTLEDILDQELTTVNNNRTAKMGRPGNNKQSHKQEKKHHQKKDADKNEERRIINREGSKTDNRVDYRASNSAEYKAGNRSQISKSTRKQDSSNVSSSKKQMCGYLKNCGGCRLQQGSYEEQLKNKQTEVNQLISKFCKVEPIIGMKDPYHYRNKVHAVFDHDRKGNPISGIYQEGSHRVIAIDSCIIHNKKADEIIVAIRGLLKSFKIKTYDEDTGYGLLRHVLVRSGFQTGEIMVVLVVSSPIFPSKNNFVKALRKLHPEITTIVLNVNDKKTSMVLGEREQTIYGKGYIEDVLCGRVFRISPKSFYQINLVQTDILYNKAIEFAKLSGEETILDAYCGIGTIGIIASDHVKRVIGVELNGDAVRDAKTNARRNQVTNVEFYQQDAGEFMSQLAGQKESIDVVFLDPPRAGSDEKFLNSLCTLNPEKVVYVSCNPVTLERDLNYLTKKGYKAVRAVPVDMFPWTEHVETCCLLKRM